MRIMTYHDIRVMTYHFVQPEHVHSFDETEHDILFMKRMIGRWRGDGSRVLALMAF